MKISNFRDFDYFPKSTVVDRVYFASVDMKPLFGLKRTVKISRDYIGSWYKVIDGTFLPIVKIEELERSYNARLRGKKDGK